MTGPTAASVAQTAAAHSLPVLVETFDGRTYLGDAEGVTGGSAPSLVILHAGYANQAYVVGDSTFVPLDTIVAIAARLGNTELLGFAS